MGVSTQRSEVRENAGMSEHGSTSDVRVSSQG